MSEPNKRRQEYKDFRFRRRYDHFLRFRLSGAKPEQIIEAARELGFNINAKDLAKKRTVKVEKPRDKSFFAQLKKFFPMLNSENRGRPI